MKSRTIDLPHGHKTRIDAADWLLVKDLTMYKGKNGYVTFTQYNPATQKNTPQYLHLFLVGGAVEGHHVDHENGDTMDNRRSNLRVVTIQKNQINRHRLNKNNSTGVRGVIYNPKESKVHPWMARICVSGKSRHIGCFATKEEAVEARRSAELEHFGEFCPTNRRSK